MSKDTDKLGNPLALLTAAEASKTPEGQKAIADVATGVKVLFVVAGTFFIGKYAYGQFKIYRAKKYANNNAGSPDLVAAAIIHDSFKRFEFPGVLSFVLPSFNYSTDESALYDIATRVTNVKGVSSAYKILFDRNLFFDVQEGLDTDEMKTFWNIINATQNNTEKDLYPIGSKLFAADRQGIRINKAIQDASGQWSGTNELFGNFALNKEVGEVIANGKWVDPGTRVETNYYIIKDCNFFGLGCEHGVVLQNQVTDKQF